MVILYLNRLFLGKNFVLKNICEQFFYSSVVVKRGFQRRCLGRGFAFV